MYTCIEARLSTGSYFPVRQRVVVLVWSSRPVQLLMYSPTRITSSSLAHFSHFKCPLSFIFSLSFPSLIPPPSSPALSLARTRSYAHHIYHTYTSLIPFSRSLRPFSPLLRPYTRYFSYSLSFSIYICMYIYIYLSPSLLCRPTWLIGLRVYLCLETASTVSLTIFHATAFTGCYLVRAIATPLLRPRGNSLITRPRMRSCTIVFRIAIGYGTRIVADGQVKLS